MLGHVILKNLLVSILFNNKTILEFRLYTRDSFTKVGQFILLACYKYTTNWDDLLISQ